MDELSMEAEGGLPLCQLELMMDMMEGARYRAIRECPVDVAISMYMTWRWSTRPPNHDYLSALTTRGPEVIDALIARIELAEGLTDYVDVPDYLYILAYGQRRGSFCVCSDAERMSRLRIAIANMQLPNEHVGDEIMEAGMHELLESVSLYMSWIERCDHCYPRSLIDDE